MVQLAGQDAMAATVAGEKNNLASGEFAGEELVGRRAKGSFHRAPFFAAKALDVVEPAATDDADAMNFISHCLFYRVVPPNAAWSAYSNESMAMRRAQGGR